MPEMAASFDRAVVVAASAVSVAACTRETAEDGTSGVGAARGLRCGGRRVVARGHDGGPGDDGDEEAQQHDHCHKGTASSSPTTGERGGVNGNVRECGPVGVFPPRVGARRRRAPTLPIRDPRRCVCRAVGRHASASGSALVRDAAAVRAPRGAGRRLDLRLGARVRLRPSSAAVASFRIRDPSPWGCDAPLTRRAPWGIRRLRLLRGWALAARGIGSVLVAQRSGVSGGDSHSMGPVGPEGKSLRKSPGQSP